jgi:DinB superfamily
MAAPDLRYPIGKFELPEQISDTDRRTFIDSVAEAPARLVSAVDGLNAEQLDTAYRPGGWTVRQVVHHLPDSHMNAYVRFKLALTETEPTVKTYEEARWAELADSKVTPIETSLGLLENLHVRWVVLLRSLAQKDWQRRFHHSEWGSVALDHALAEYAWHGRHHVAHISELRQRMGWA